MPGPPPKHPSLRQRRNKTTTAAKLAAEPVDREVPALQPRYVRDPETHELRVVEWHPRTVEWWGIVWSSPMAAEWLDADVPGLELVAALRDDFHRAETVGLKLKAAAELRLQEARFGLTPIDRRRLQWEVERGESAVERVRRRRREQRPALAGVDPRVALERDELRPPQD